MARKKSTSSKTKKKSTSPRTTKRKKQKKSFLGFAFKWMFVLGLWATIILGCILAWYATELPNITRSAAFERQSSIRILASDGSEIARYGEIKGISVKAEDMPAHLKNAVLAIEDRRFYNHPGIDPLGIARAFYVNLTQSGVVQGGSTITQQLAKNLFLSHERRLKRKIQEAMLAVWLEYELSKDEILSAYLNRVYLGSGTYGVDAASRLYFKKEVKDLNLREAAIIAGLLKAPTRYSPRRNPALSNERADIVISAMVDAGYLTEEQAKDETGKPPTPEQKPEHVNTERYFTDWVVDGLDELIGTPEMDLIVHTTLNPAIQKNVENALMNTLNEVGEEKKISQGAAVVMGHDGAVLGMMGGRNYGESQFNRATQARRQPGSSFKPFVYLAAIEKGWRPYDTIMDEPITSGRYRPKNFAGQYYGEVDIQTALTFSLNTVAYQLIKDIGPDAVVDVARRLGIISPLQADLSLALGTYGVSPLELTSAYAVIANGGYAVFPYAITKIEDEDGNTHYTRPRTTKTRLVASPSAIYDLQSMMRSVVENGTGRGAAQGFPVAGKTGTSQEYRDAWFAGYSDRLVTVVWVGNDDNESTKRVTGGSVPAQIWSKIMRNSQHAFRPTSRFTLASGDGFSGLLGRLLGNSDEQEINDDNNRYRFGSEYNNRPRSQETGAQESHESNRRYNN